MKPRVEQKSESNWTLDSGDLFPIQAILWKPGTNDMKTIRYERQVTQATQSPGPLNSCQASHGKCAF